MERLTSRDKFGTVINNLTVEKGRASCKDIHGKLAEYEDLEEQGRLIKLPCKIGDNYTGICQEMNHDKKGWKAVRWLDSGKIETIEIIVSMTAEKAGYNHSRNIDELGKCWFVGKNAKEEAERALEGIINNV